MVCSDLLGLYCRSCQSWWSWFVIGINGDNCALAGGGSDWSFASASMSVCLPASSPRLNCTVHSARTHCNCQYQFPCCVCAPLRVCMLACMYGSSVLRRLYVPFQLYPPWQRSIEPLVWSLVEMLTLHFDSIAICFMDKWDLFEVGNSMVFVAQLDSPFPGQYWVRFQGHTLWTSNSAYYGFYSTQPTHLSQAMSWIVVH